MQNKDDLSNDGVGVKTGHRLSNPIHILDNEFYRDTSHYRLF